MAADRPNRPDQGSVHQGDYVKPSLNGRAAAHHANSELVVLDQKTGQYVDGERLTEDALGKVGEVVPPDACRTLPAQSMVRWDVHYYPVGRGSRTT